jgi:PAS domain S-box-containing protein
MSLTKKSMVITISTIICLMVAMYLTSRFILRTSLEKLEHEKTLKNLQIAYDVLISDIENFNRSNGDWAIWDDTYRFIKRPNKKYIVENLPERSFINLKINYIFFLDEDGKLIFSKGVSLIENKETSVPIDFTNYIKDDTLLKQHKSDESSTKGIIIISNTPMLVTSRPVIHSNGRGPSNGTIIMLRVLDSIGIFNLSNLAHIPIKIFNYKDINQSELKPVFLSLSKINKYCINPVNEELISGYALIENVYGESALILRTEERRSIFKEWETSSNYFMILIVVFGIFFGLTVTLILNKLFLKRVLLLSNIVKRVGISNQSIDFPVKGKDELTSLSKEIKLMLINQKKDFDDLTNEIINRKQIEEKLETLLNIASELYSVKDFEDIGKIVFSELKKLQWEKEFGAKLAIVDNETNLYKVVYVLEGDNFSVPSDRHCKINEVQHFSGYVLKTEKNLVIQNSHSEIATSIDNRLLEKPPGSLIFIPLFHNNLIVGIFSIGIRPPYFFTDDILNYLESIGRFTSIAVGELFARIKREESRKDLKDSEEKYRLLFENNPQPVFVCEVESKKILAVNQIAIREYGFSHEEFLQMTMEDLTLSEYVYPFSDHITHHGDELKHSVGRHLHKDKSISDVELVSLPLVFNSLNSRLFIVNNITNRIQTENELIEAKESADLANRSKSEFLANMSHEIRTPMNAILGFTDILTDKISDPILKNYLNIIRTSGDALLALINDILDISKIESGKYELQPEFMDLNRMLMDLNFLFFQKFKEKGLEFILDIDDNLPARLYLDEGRVRQILLNLISNAIKFCEDGYIKITSRFNYINESKDKIDIYLSVEDTGIGIPADQLEKIFKPFEQVDGQSTRRFGGTGLGLAIASNLITKMNGSISVNSVIGKGSIFIVNLQKIDVIDELKFAEKMVQTSQIDIEFEPKNILVVDDIEFNRVLLKLYLEKYNLNVIQIDSGKKALVLMEDNNFDLLIIDMKMPDMTGLELAKIIHGMEKFKNIPRIAYTASAFKEQEDRVLEYFDGYLRKPVERNQLINELKKFLPHKSIIKKEEVTINNGVEEEGIFQESIIDVEKKEQLIDKLNNLFLKKWEKISELIEIRSITNFASELKDTGIEFGSNLVIKYAVELLDSTRLYKVIKIKNQMKIFPDLVERIKNL